MLVSLVPFTVLAILLVFAIALLASSVRVLREYQRGVVFRLGRLLGDPKGPRLFLLIPIVDRMVQVDLRTITLVVPPQDVITRDNVPAKVNAVAYFSRRQPGGSHRRGGGLRAGDASDRPDDAAFGAGAAHARRAPGRAGQDQPDPAEDHRPADRAVGIKVKVVEVKDLEIPTSMQRAMARQGESERERRAKVISAEGEFQASAKLAEAAAVIGEHPIALQLRYLQTLLEISGTNNTTTILPVPIDLMLRPV